MEGNHAGRCWPIDPQNVVYGVVNDDQGRNCSRSHVLVHYAGDSGPHLVPLNRFVQETGSLLRRGRPLAIEHLRIAPSAWCRYRAFFDRLTNWLPATQIARETARVTRPDPRLSELPPTGSA